MNEYYSHSELGSNQLKIPLGIETVFARAIVVGNVGSNQLKIPLGIETWSSRRMDPKQTVPINLKSH